MKRIELKKVLGKASMIFMFMAFSLLSVQDLAAQNYVSSSEAQDILKQELQEVADTYYFYQGNPSSKDHQYDGLVIFTYKMVLQDLINGSTVKDAIEANPLQEGKVSSTTAGTLPSSKNGVLSNWERADVAVSSLGDTDVSDIVTGLTDLLTN